MAKTLTSEAFYSGLGLVEEESEVGDWGNEGTNGFAGAGAGVAGEGFAGALGAAAGDWAKVDAVASQVKDWLLKGSVMKIISTGNYTIQNLSCPHSLMVNGLSPIVPIHNPDLV
ncbi:hypothetical protein RJT34_13882 [Clitoria ternatea]|uniref:Uncharacterized protein n=1 Tax=Clitoria ternatea TaxID=43366 RepID=A0AAN9JRJ2_CLITE